MIRPFRAKAVYEFECPRCGEKITTEAGEGKCPKCELLYSVGVKMERPKGDNVAG